MAPYRTGGRDIGERAAAHRNRIAELEALFSDAFWERAAPLLNAGAPGDLERSPTTAEGVELLARRAERLEQLSSRARQLQDELGTARSELGPRSSPADPESDRPPKGWPPRPRPEGTAWTTPEALAVALDDWAPGTRLIRARLQERSLQAWWLGAAGIWSAWFVDARGPFEAISGVIGTQQEGTEQWLLRTTVSPLAAPLRVETEGVFQDLAQSFGILQEVELGDPEFDGVFWVKGDPISAKALLGPEVRQLLIQIGTEWAPILKIADGVAELMGRGSPRAAAQSLALLSRLHRVHHSVAFLKV